MCRKPGFYLGILDLALIALEKGKTLILLHGDDEPEGLRPRNVLEVMESFVPTAVYWEGEKEMDFAALDTWIMLSCKANFAPATFRQLDHWIPLFSKQQEGEEEFRTNTERVAGRLTKGLASIRKALEGCEEGANQSEDEEWKESLVTRMSTLEWKQILFKNLIAMDLDPVEVKGDGNCAIWAALTLQAGPFIRTSLLTEQAMLVLRQATCLYMLEQHL